MAKKKKKKKQFSLGKILSSLWEKLIFRIYILAVVGIAFIAVMITVIINYQKQSRLEEELGQRNSYTMSQLYDITQKPGVDDLVITNRWDDRDWLFPENFRKLKKKWTEDDVAPFWIPLGEGEGRIDVKGLTRENMLRIENILEEVP